MRLDKAALSDMAQAIHVKFEHLFRSLSAPALHLLPPPIVRSKAERAIDRMAYRREGLST